MWVIWRKMISVLWALLSTECLTSGPRMDYEFMWCIMNLQVWVYKELSYVTESSLVSSLTFSGRSQTTFKKFYFLLPTASVGKFPYSNFSKTSHFHPVLTWSVWTLFFPIGNIIVLWLHSSFHHGITYLKGVAAPSPTFYFVKPRMHLCCCSRDISSNFIHPH